MLTTTTRLTTLAALAILAVATPTPTPNPSADGVGPGTAGPCAAQCCLALMPANSTAGSALLGALGAAVGDVTSLVGIACESADGAAACTTHEAPVCCDNSQDNLLAGIISLSCLPIPI